MTIAFIGHTGPYGELPFEMYTERLYGWAKEKRILPGFYPMAICYDNPDETPPEECRTDIATAFAVPSGGSTSLAL